MTDYAAWTNTDIDYTFNAYNKLSGGLDTAFTPKVMTMCRQMAPNRCVLDNHALADADHERPEDLQLTSKAWAA